MHATAGLSSVDSCAIVDGMITAADISKARHLLGESHKEFAKRFNVARSTIYHWEKHGPPSDGYGAYYVANVMETIKTIINVQNSE